MKVSEKYCSKCGGYTLHKDGVCVMYHGFSLTAFAQAIAHSSAVKTA